MYCTEANKTLNEKSTSFLIDSPLHENLTLPCTVRPKVPKSHGQTMTAFPPRYDSVGVRQEARLPCSQPNGEMTSFSRVFRDSKSFLKMWLLVDWYGGIQEVTVTKVKF